LSPAAQPLTEAVEAFDFTAATSISGVSPWFSFHQAEIPPHEIRVETTGEYASLVFHQAAVLQSAVTKLCAELAEHSIEIPNHNDVLRYLEQHVDLAAVVPSVCGQARQEFGDAAQLIIDIYRDPEIDDRYLRLCVRLPSYSDDTMAQVDHVSEPFDEDLCRASGYLLVTTDFRPPQAKHAI
jgi:hypothetical protein